MITKNQMGELEQLSRPLIEFINNNFDPHTKIVVSYDRTDIVTELAGIPILDFID